MLASTTKPAGGLLCLCLLVAQAVAAPCAASAIETSQTSEVSLAIINKQHNADLADLIFASLSNAKEFSLVERNQIDLALKEQALSISSRDGNVRLGQLVRADALLFIEPESDLSRLHVILVETLRGVRLFENTYVFGGNARGEAIEKVTEDIDRFGRKLRVDQVHRRYVAILPFVCKRRWTDIPSLPLLRAGFQSHLTGQEHLFVVERKHIETVVSEGTIANGDPQDLSIADFAVAVHLDMTPKDNIAVKLQLRNLTTQASESTDFEVDWILDENVDRATSNMCSWIARRIADQGPPREIPAASRMSGDAATEARKHYAKGLELTGGERWKALSGGGGRNGADDSYCAKVSAAIEAFGAAYSLQPTNMEYARGYLTALTSYEVGGDDRYEAALSDALQYFMRAMELSRALDPSRTNACVMPPQRLNNSRHPDKIGVTTVVENCQDDRNSDERRLFDECRVAARQYYEWHCGCEEGLPDPGRRGLLANVCPLFFDEPEQAMKYLKGVIAREDFDWGSQKIPHQFLRNAYWDRENARKIWMAFLQNIEQTGSPQAQAYAYRASYDCHAACSGGASPDAVRACRDLFAWAAARPEDDVGKIGGDLFEWPSTKWNEVSRTVFEDPGMMFAFAQMGANDQGKYFPLLLRIIAKREKRVWGDMRECEAQCRKMETTFTPKDTTANFRALLNRIRDARASSRPASAVR